MSVLASLKLVPIKPRAQRSPAEHRRNKLVSRIDEQIELAKCTIAGEKYEATRLRTNRDEAGNRSQVLVARRVRPWWYAAENGKVLVQLMYGSHRVELAKGRFAVEIDDLSKLVETLFAMKEAVNKCELDAAIAASAVRK